ncbi:pentapeptide repeat-containing protein [Yoonia vestfoldensis]|uniref:pentapeptide repeat-containing protein n=1 Tax=Yoonia vestfoldensis TaxID=245188 RepID=UPI000362D960|nr:pentapeptide repeat-containing protein [Yoonia vestfoldensis]
MNRLLEDMLSEGELSSIDAVFAAPDTRFDKLVKLVGLNPLTDFQYADLRGTNFCGADLRGFDFTGSDLRDCIRNDKTVVDHSTILVNADVQWIDVEYLPIVAKMQDIEISQSSEKRKDLLSELIADFGKTDHVVAYMVSAAVRSDDLDKFIDFASFLPAELSQSQFAQIRASGIKLFRKKIAQSRSRTRRKTTAIFAYSEILAKLSEQPGSLAAGVYSRLADLVMAKQQTEQLRWMSLIEDQDFEKALDSIGH